MSIPSFTPRVSEADAQLGLSLRSPKKWHSSHFLRREDLDEDWIHPTGFLTRLSSCEILGQDPGELVEPIVETRPTDVEVVDSIAAGMRLCREIEKYSGTQLCARTRTAAVSVLLLKAFSGNLSSLAVRDHLDIYSLTLETPLATGDKDRFAQVSPEEVKHCEEYSQRAKFQLDVVNQYENLLQDNSDAANNTANDQLRVCLQAEIRGIRENLQMSKDQLQKTNELATERKAAAIQKLQSSLTNLQIRESQKAIKQARTVNRLMTLAFIFIPFSAVCGFFGMNIKESPSFTWWVYGTAEGVVLLVSILFAFSTSLYQIAARTAYPVDHFCRHWYWVYPWPGPSWAPWTHGEYRNVCKSAVLSAWVPLVYVPRHLVQFGRWASFKTREIMGIGQNLNKGAHAQDFVHFSARQRYLERGIGGLPSWPNLRGKPVPEKLVCNM